MRYHTLWLEENLVRGSNRISDLTDNFVEWRDSTRDVGGCYAGEGTYTGTPGDLKRFFYSNLGRRIVRSSVSGIEWWEGIITRMDWTHRGTTLVRSLENMANWTKVIYTKIGVNLLTIGDVDSGIWAVVGTPTTHERIATWHARGSYGMHVITDAASEGTTPGTVAVTAGTAYVCKMLVEIVSGTWTLQVIDSGGAVLASRSTDGNPGRIWLQCQIPDTNATTDGACPVQLIASAGAAEIYADWASFRTAPDASETDWQTDDSSVNEYGRMESIFLEGEMTDDEAEGKALERLTELAWARTLPPNLDLLSNTEDVEQDILTVTCSGLWWTMGWRHLLNDGNEEAATYTANILAEAEFVSANIADANTVDVNIEADTPLNLWRAMEKVIAAGDGAGAPWMGGTYPGQIFDYQARPTAIVYHYQNGQMMRRIGGSVNPSSFRPGWCQLVDLAPDPTPAGATAQDDPSRVWLYETEFLYSDDETTLGWAVERR